MRHNVIRNRSDSESSESDMSPERNHFKITSNPAKLASHDLPSKKYNESSQSDISSLSEDEEDDFQQQRMRIQNNKRTIEVERDDDTSSVSSESSGIDVIEERIKRLEVDLEAKIQKQKQNISVKVTHERQGKEKIKAPILKNSLHANPPLPPHVKQEQKPQFFHKLQNPFYNEKSQNKNEMNINEKEIAASMKETIKESKFEQIIVVDPSKQVAVSSPKKNQSKKVVQEKQSPGSKDRISSKNTKSKGELNAVGLLNKAHRQIDQMQKVIDDLKKENAVLKDEIGRSKKKTSNQDISKLRKLSSGGDLKLEKQIETLKAIESLQAKLKKSIAKKLKKNKINSGLSAQLQC